MVEGTVLARSGASRSSRVRVAAGPNQHQMAAAEPEQIARRRQLQGPKVQHPLGRHDQPEPKHQGQGQSEVEGLTLAGRILQAAGNGGQRNGVVGGEHGLQGHQQGQQQQHLPPLVGLLKQRCEGLDRLRFHGLQRVRMVFSLESELQSAGTLGNSTWA